jgi:hypothetical protein
MSNEIENHEKIYEKLISILNVKFKIQQKGTEIYFKNFYKMKNLISDEEDYLLILNGKKSIRFVKKKEFYAGMIFIIKSNIYDLNKKYKELQKRCQDDAIIDENEMFMRHEYIGYCGFLV